MNNLIFKCCPGLLLRFILMAVLIQLPIQLSIQSSAQASEAISAMDMTKKSLVVSNAWIRLMPPVTSSTAAYFSLENQSDKAIEIVRISTLIAKKSSMHDTKVENDMASMVPLKTLIIASGSSVVFAPGGKHLMIMGLTEKLAENKDVTLEFELKNAETITATMKVYKNNPHSEEIEKSSMEQKHKHQH
ncbi:MAG: copper(I)-binding protein [Enterobacterales bacterium]|jgi:copper(I)-binding protein